ncbi:MAG TPA: response regulator transcription factor [Verrucomicrobiae bacterium]|nr:response regulator transcription factor [Verrucomicrobiae bacterium]
MNRPKIKSAGAKHRIFLVDDHPVTRDGLARLINHEADLEVCGTAGTPASAVEHVEQQKPDLVMIDVSLGKGASGLELIKDLASRHRRLKMLALSTHDEALYAERALRAGARGYVMKQEPTEHVMQAIRKILNGEVHLSNRMSDRLLHRITQPHAAPTISDIETLSDRELEVYRLLGQGRGTRQIAAELHLSVSTVETHRAHIKEKLNLNSTPELLRHAVEWVHSQAS